MKTLSVFQNEYINELLVKFPIGIKVLFTHELGEWQKTTAITNQKTVIDCNNCFRIRKYFFSYVD